MFGMGQTELLLVVGVAILLFGAKRIPEVAKSLGKSLNAFKQGLSEAADPKPETKKDAGGEKIA